ncbi:hypothetical protein [uncultured Acetobacteroides sp.]|uniref:hypothetical protein n=1 Tax=uncultured Acetobacteroides sp. TaxID=1760811 RepID=UPI0029F5CBAD|nr:hypothetical protein [uncultured Acetobacteroides sp.]
MKEQLMRLLSGWHFTRILYLVIGLASLGYGIYLSDATSYAIAGLFLLQAIFNISFCGAAGCCTASSSKPRIEVGRYKPKH